MKRQIILTVILLGVSTSVMWNAIHGNLKLGDYVFIAAMFLTASLDPVLDEITKRRRGQAMIDLIRSSPLYRSRHSNGRR